MAYHAKKQGEDAFQKRITRKDTRCFVCNEQIPKGSERYVSSGSNSSLCVECYQTWMKEGGKLGNISRTKIDLRF